MGAGISEFRVLEPNKIVQQLLTFVESEISAFNMSDEFVEILSVKKNENQHSLSFCLLDNQCQSKFILLERMLNQDLVLLTLVYILVQS